MGWIFRHFALFLVSWINLYSYQWSKNSEVQHASHADYIFLTDESGREWIYKQIVDPAPDDQVVTILEVVASKIAKALEISLNDVEIISSSNPFEFRLFPNCPGSLHLKVKGKCIEHGPPWSAFDLHQKIRSPFLIKRKGPLSPKEIGLRREIILTMSKHSDLPKIAALDTYLGNSDRSLSNIFYDESTDTYYGIDMGSCLTGNLAEKAIEQLQNAQGTFSMEEVIGLNRYRNALVSLVIHFPPAKTISLLNDCLEEAGFVPDNERLWSRDLEKKITKWKILIEESYCSSIELIHLLDRFNEL